jgi:hypothetical protein
MLSEGQPNLKSTFQEIIMSALRKNVSFEAYSAEAESSKPTWEPVLYKIVRRPRTEPAARVESASAVRTAKNIALFLVSPFIGLTYIVAMPFVAAGMLAYFAGKALCNKFPMVKHAAMLAAAPLIGLAFILAAPVAGLAALGYMSAKAVAKN